VWRAAGQQKETLFLPLSRSRWRSEYLGRSIFHSSALLSFVGRGSSRVGFQISRVMIIEELGMVGKYRSAVAVDPHHPVRGCGVALIPPTTASCPQIRRSSTEVRSTYCISIALQRARVRARTTRKKQETRRSCGRGACTVQYSPVQYSKPGDRPPS
jgi:hypothetical protein